MQPHVTCLTTTGTIGGAEMCLLDLLELGVPSWELSAILGTDGPLRAAIDGLRREVAVEPIPARLAKLGDSDRSRFGKFGQLAKFGTSLIATCGYASRLRNRLMQIQSRIVHTIDMKSHFLAAIRAAKRSMGLVWHLHDYLSRRPAMSRLLRIAAKRRPDVIVVGVTESVSADAKAVLGGTCRVRTISNGIDLDRFQPTLPSRPETLRVGLVATFARWKGHETFLRAASMLPPGLCQFSVVGGPLYRSVGSQYTLEELQELASALSVQNQVQFMGHVTQPELAYRGLDIVVHASNQPEPFGRAIAEAMACGKAVISTGLGGADEVIGQGEYALKVPPNDPKALAEAIAFLVENPEQRQELAQSAQAWACLQFDRRRLPAQWSAIYEEALSS